MEPRIQYAKTSDGVNIAFTVVGSGPPVLVSGDLADAHVQLMWQHSPYAPFYERLTERYTVIKFDSRGYGLSDRDVEDFSLDSLLLDVNAVADQLDLSSFGVLGLFGGGPLAIAFAARRPDQVTRLCLVGTSVRTRETLARHRAFRIPSLMREDWDLFLQNLAAVNYGFGKEESARTAEFLAAALDQNTLLQSASFVNAWDVTDSLPLVRCPTLIVHYSGIHYLTMDMARELAAGIPDSHLLVLDYASALRDDQVVAAVVDFFADEEARADPTLPSGMTAIFVADIVESTALTERLGDTAFRERARALDGSLRTIIREAGGTPVEGKLLGDGVLATFASARQAIEAALRCGSAGDECGLPLHLGLHAGDVIREDDNVYGGAVNIAARVSALAAPGEVLVSQTVRDLARTSAAVTFEDAGERSLKGVSEPLRLWRVAPTI
ncbi:MAG TPA: adenylate/guanylate cyclase domain-containing protein [Dehalococcoidia bacterium]|nr:adenylate/guanylate cyclase domain-containing protein [Dehalococcoidia bacterium]